MFLAYILNAEDMLGQGVTRKTWIDRLTEAQIDTIEKLASHIKAVKILLSDDEANFKAFYAFVFKNAREEKKPAWRGRGVALRRISSGSFPKARARETRGEDRRGAGVVAGVCLGRKAVPPGGGGVGMGKPNESARASNSIIIALSFSLHSYNCPTRQSYRSQPWPLRSDLAPRFALPKGTHSSSRRWKPTRSGVEL